MDDKDRCAVCLGAGEMSWNGDAIVPCPACLGTGKSMEFAIQQIEDRIYQRLNKRNSSPDEVNNG